MEGPLNGRKCIKNMSRRTPLVPIGTQSTQETLITCLLTTQFDSGEASKTKNVTKTWYGLADSDLSAKEQCFLPSTSAPSQIKLQAKKKLAKRIASQKGF